MMVSGPRYRAFETAGEQTIIYDVEVPQAWYRSDVAVEVPEFQ